MRATEKGEAGERREGKRSSCCMYAYIHKTQMRRLKEGATERERCTTAVQPALSAVVQGNPSPLICIPEASCPERTRTSPDSSYNTEYISSTYA